MFFLSTSLTISKKIFVKSTRFTFHTPKKSKILKIIASHENFPVSAVIAACISVKRFTARLSSSATTCYYYGTRARNTVYN